MSDDGGLCKPWDGESYPTDDRGVVRFGAEKSASEAEGVVRPGGVDQADEPASPSELSHPTQDRAAPSADDADHECCWHTAEALLSNPPQQASVCCWCGERKVTVSALVEFGTHGPYARSPISRQPSGYTFGASAETSLRDGEGPRAEPTGAPATSREAGGDDPGSPMSVPDASAPNKLDRTETALAGLYGAIDGLWSDLFQTHRTILKPFMRKAIRAIEGWDDEAVDDAGTDWRAILEPFRNRGLQLLAAVDLVLKDADDGVLEVGPGLDTLRRYAERMRDLTGVTSRSDSAQNHVTEFGGGI